jgi:hypothetical protein
MDHGRSLASIERRRRRLLKERAQRIGSSGLQRQQSAQGNNDQEKRAHAGDS